MNISYCVVSKTPQRSLRAFVPWWARIAGKLVLSRIPLNYRAWRGLNIFTHGLMERPAYALDVFQEHFSQSGLPRGKPFTCMELGPGDSLFSAVVARAHGAVHTYLVDDGSFATSEVTGYREVAGCLKSQGLDPPDLGGAPDVVAVLALSKATYHIRGLESLRSIPTASIDFIWSHAVLEHVRRAELPAMACEMRRVLREGGGLLSPGGHQGSPWRRAEQLKDSKRSLGKGMDGSLRLLYQQA